MIPSLFPRSPLIVPCPISLSLSMLFGGASRMNTVVIAVDRYVAIKWPFWYNTHVSKRFLAIAVLTAWVWVSIVSVLPPAGVGLNNDSNQSTSAICFYFNTLSIPFLYVFILTFNIFPLVIIIPANIFLFRESCRHLKSIHSQRNNIGVINPVSEQTQQKKTNHSTKKLILQSKVSRMIATLVFTCVILVAPISIIDLIQVASTVQAPETISQIAVAMIYLNNSANVFIYAGFNKEFRKTFMCMYSTARLPFNINVVKSKSPASFSLQNANQEAAVNTDIKLLKFTRRLELP